MANKTTFTRLAVTDLRSAQIAVQDIYDKLSRLQGATAVNAEIEELKKQLEDLKKSVATGDPEATINPNSANPVVPAASIQDATGLAANPQYAFIPALKNIPSNNPTAGKPYAQDGLMILHTPDPTTPGLFYRYSKKTYEWVGPQLGVNFTGTHAQRLALDLTYYAQGLYFAETDRQSIYVIIDVLGVLSWKYVTGFYEADISARPSDLGLESTGFRFKDSTAQRTYYWTGTVWRDELELGTLLACAHSDRVAEGTCNINNPLGVVTVTGTTVSYLSGDNFDTGGYLPGKRIYINFIPYTIASVTNATTLVLTSPGINGTWNYRMGFGRLIWATGTPFGAWTNFSIMADYLEYTVGYVNIGLQYLFTQEEALPTVVGAEFYLTEFAANKYVINTPLYELDRYVEYLTADAGGTLDSASIIGTVNTNNFTVTWVSGDKFGPNTYWAGKTISINGLPYTILQVNSPTQLLVTTTAGVQSNRTFIMATQYKILRLTGQPFDPRWTGSVMTIFGFGRLLYWYQSSDNSFYVDGLGLQLAVSWYIPSARWRYLTGQYDSIFADKPVGFTINDFGFRWGCTDRFHVFIWAGSSWVFAPEDNGSGYIVDSIGTPLGGLWHVVDGSTVSITKSDATLQTGVVLPDWENKEAFEASPFFGVGTWSPGSRPTWETGAKTDDNNIGHTHDVDRGSVVVESGTGATVGASGLTNTGPESNAHYHALTDGNAQLKIVNSNNGGLPPKIGFRKYIRL